MEQRRRGIRIELTEEQRRVIRESTGEDAAALEFQGEELEERVVPTRLLFLRGDGLDFPEFPTKF